MKPRHFLTLLDLNPSELKQVIERAVELKHFASKTLRKKPCPAKC